MWKEILLLSLFAETEENS